MKCWWNVSKSSDPIYSVHEQIFWPTNLWKNMHASNFDAIPWNLAPIRCDDEIHIAPAKLHAQEKLLLCKPSIFMQDTIFCLFRWLFTYSTMGFITIKLTSIWEIFQFFPTNNPTTIFYPWLGKPIINQLGCNGIPNRNRQKTPWILSPPWEAGRWWWNRWSVKGPWLFSSKYFIQGMNKIVLPAVRFMDYFTNQSFFPNHQ